MPLREPRDYKSGDAPPNGCVHGIQGRRPTMEDETFYASWYYGDENPTTPLGRQKMTAYGVLDGHGGAQASKFVKRWLPWILAHWVNPTGTVTQVKKEITECFLRLQNFMWDYSESKKGLFDYQGTTVSMFLWTHEYLFCVNAGDSRCVWCRSGRPQPLSVDHKPSDASERRRIESLGGGVSNRRGDVPRVEPVGLATSRSLGDLDSRRRLNGTSLPRGTYLVSPVPDIVVVPRSAIGGTDFAVLACDGLWDVLSNNDACHVTKKEGITKACRTLVALAYRMGSTDNISVMVVHMSDPSEISAEGVYHRPKLGPTIINPLTGRPIKYMGPTHKKLLQATCSSLHR